MITITSLDVNGLIFTGMQIVLPETNLFIIANERGYIMNASFRVQFANQLEHERLIAATTSTVHSIDDLFHAHLEEVTTAASKFGWRVGMRGKDALLTIT
ncbi:MAG TPA: DUF1805 domain-containing protein [Pseudogracilibacillus sp.]|nr:DUF1805 domain-containing protein [Pseudogracilibacillus sp.]